MALFIVKPTINAVGQPLSISFTVDNFFDTAVVLAIGGVLFFGATFAVACLVASINQPPPQPRFSPPQVQPAHLARPRVLSPMYHAGQLPATPVPAYQPTPASFAPPAYQPTPAYQPGAAVSPPAFQPSRTTVVPLAYQPGAAVAPRMYPSGAAVASPVYVPQTATYQQPYAPGVNQGYVPTFGQPADSSTYRRTW